MDRKIILDTETTGFSPIKGDKIVEIACVELLNDTDIGEKFHYYINPERDIPYASTAVHGISIEDVKDSPIFKDIAEDLIKFIGDSKIIAHNADFDKEFINYELNSCGFSVYKDSIFIDTLAIAKQRFPKQKNSLDALCDRFNVNRSERKDYHGALIDVILLKDVYLHLSRVQSGMIEDTNVSLKENKDVSYETSFNRKLVIQSNNNLHSEFIEKNIKNSIWKNN